MVREPLQQRALRLAQVYARAIGGRQHPAAVRKHPDALPAAVLVGPRHGDRLGHVDTPGIRATLAPDRLQDRGQFFGAGLRGQAIVGTRHIGVDAPINGGELADRQYGRVRKLLRT